MKTLFFGILTVLFLATSSLVSYSRDVFVNGYYKSNGTYVNSYHRSAPDGNTFNNWSTKGNVNPYTGEAGNKDPFREMNRNHYRYRGFNN